MPLSYGEIADEISPDSKNPASVDIDFAKRILRRAKAHQAGQRADQPQDVVDALYAAWKGCNFDANPNLNFKRFVSMLPPLQLK